MSQEPIRFKIMNGELLSGDGDVIMLDESRPVDDVDEDGDADMAEADAPPTEQTNANAWPHLRKHKAAERKISIFVSRDICNSLYQSLEEKKGFPWIQVGPYDEQKRAVELSQTRNLDGGLVLVFRPSTQDMPNEGVNYEVRFLIDERRCRFANCGEQNCRFEDNADAEPELFHLAQMQKEPGAEHPATQTILQKKVSYNAYYKSVKTKTGHSSALMRNFDALFEQIRQSEVYNAALDELVYRFSQFVDGFGATLLMILAARNSRQLVDTMHRVLSPSNMLLQLRRVDALGRTAKQHAQICGHEDMAKYIDEITSVTEAKIHEEQKNQQTPETPTGEGELVPGAASSASGGKSTRVTISIKEKDTLFGQKPKGSFAAAFTGKDFKDQQQLKEMRKAFGKFADYVIKLDKQIREEDPSQLQAQMDAVKRIKQKLGSTGDIQRDGVVAAFQEYFLREVKAAYSTKEKLKEFRKVIEEKAASVAGSAANVVPQGTNKDDISANFNTLLGYALGVPPASVQPKLKKQTPTTGDRASSSTLSSPLEGPQVGQKRTHEDMQEEESQQAQRELIQAQQFLLDEYDACFGESQQLLKKHAERIAAAKLKVELSQQKVQEAQYGDENQPYAKVAKQMLGDQPPYGKTDVEAGIRPEKAKTEMLDGQFGKM